MIGLSIAILGLFSFAIFAAHAFDAYREANPRTADQEQSARGMKSAALAHGRNHGQFCLP